MREPKRSQTFTDHLHLVTPGDLAGSVDGICER